MLLVRENIEDRTIQDGDLFSCACDIDLAASILIPVPDTNEADRILFGSML
jgi:hypothetical protein